MPISKLLFQASPHSWKTPLLWLPTPGGAATVQPVSDADFAAYIEKQNKIFKTSGDLSALLRDQRIKQVDGIKS